MLAALSPQITEIPEHARALRQILAFDIASLARKIRFTPSRYLSRRGRVGLEFPRRRRGERKLGTGKSHWMRGAFGPPYHSAHGPDSEAIVHARGTHRAHCSNPQLLRNLRDTIQSRLLSRAGIASISPPRRRRCLGKVSWDRKDAYHFPSSLALRNGMDIYPRSLIVFSARIFASLGPAKRLRDKERGNDSEFTTADQSTAA